MRRGEDLSGFILAFRCMQPEPPAPCHPEEYRSQLHAIRIGEIITKYLFGKTSLPQALSLVKMIARLKPFSSIGEFSAGFDVFTEFFGFNPSILQENYSPAHLQIVLNLLWRQQRLHHCSQTR
ncbi:MAG TPA: hypothetical protein VJ969_11610 [Desulfopila sp.]|nr:hypothetical protein [Desulfopila sp.]